MKKFLFLWICVVFHTLPSDSLYPITFQKRPHPYSEKPITLIVPAYNTKQWYQATLDSILTQKYTHFRVIYVDDHSTDGSGDLVKHYLAQYDPEHKVTFIQNKERVGALANIFFSVWMCDPSDIIVTVDGDDCLAHPNVLSFINSIYTHSDVWMTYGQFIEYPTGHRGGAQPLPEHIIHANAFRDYDWVTTHLRTFYAGLFQKIDPEDLLYEGHFFPCGWDLAFMFPLLEMAGVHSQFIPDVLYIYNVDNPLNDLKHHKEKQIFLEKIIRARPRYQPIHSLGK